MKISHAVALACLLAPASGALAWGGADRKANLFDAAAMSSPSQQAAVAKKYWKGTGLRKIQAAGYKKAAIVEFSVEYVTMEKKDWGGHGNFGLLDIAQAASGAGKKQMRLDETLKARLPRELYEQLRERLAAAGFEVKTLEEVTASPAFQELTGSGDATTKTSRYDNAGYNDGKEKKETYPVEGLINIKMGAFAAMGNMETQAELASQLGADILLRAHFRVGVEKGGRPSLESGSWISVGAGPTASTGPGGNPRHGFTQWGRLDAKDGFMFPEDCADSAQHQGAKGKVFDLNEAKYEAALKQMFPAFAGMAVTLLDSEDAGG